MNFSFKHSYRHNIKTQEKFRVNLGIRGMLLINKWPKSLFTKSNFGRSTRCVTSCEVVFDECFGHAIEKKTPKIVGTKPLNPKTKKHKTRPHQSLLNTCFSLLYSHEGYPKQLTIHNSRMVQHSLRYYCNSALLKLCTHKYLHSCLVTA